MKIRIALLFAIFLGSLTASAHILPDCSGPGLDNDARIIVIPRTSPENVLYAIELISKLDEKFIINTFHFPIFAADDVTITFHINWNNNRGGYLKQSLEAIAGMEGASVGCLPYRPGET